MKSLEARQARLRDLYELGDIDKAEYVRRRDEIIRQIEELAVAAEPTSCVSRPRLGHS